MKFYFISYLKKLLRILKNYTYVLGNSSISDLYHGEIRGISTEEARINQIRWKVSHLATIQLWLPDKEMKNFQGYGHPSKRRRQGIELIREEGFTRPSPMQLRGSVFTHEKIRMTQNN